jgi:hypothetical protein
VSKLQRSAYSAREDLEHGLNGGEAGLAGIAAIGGDPIDLIGGGIDARLDAAMSFLDGGLGDQLDGRRGAKVVLDIGLQGGLVALQGEQIVGFMDDDLVGNFHLAPDGVDGDERLPSMAIISCGCGHSARTQPVKQRPNKVGSMRLTRLRSHRSQGMP